MRFCSSEIHWKRKRKSVANINAFKIAGTI